MHLGVWTIKNELTESSLKKWVTHRCYFSGERINYMDNCYKVDSDYCTALPGCKTHQKFHRLFSNPIRIVSVLLLLKLCCFMGVMILAYMNRRWYAVVINIIEVLCNSHTFFILCRDFFVLFYSENLKHKKFI